MVGGAHTEGNPFFMTEVAKSTKGKRRPQRLRVRSLHQPMMGLSKASIRCPAVNRTPTKTLGSSSIGPNNSGGTAGVLHAGRHEETKEPKVPGLGYSLALNLVRSIEELVDQGQAAGIFSVHLQCPHRRLQLLRRHPIVFSARVFYRLPEPDFDVAS